MWFEKSCCKDACDCKKETPLWRDFLQSAWTVLRKIKPPTRTILTENKNDLDSFNSARVSDTIVSDNPTP